MDDKTTLAAIGIICLTVLEVVALLVKLDGQIFASIVAAITFMVGLVFGVKVKIKGMGDE